MFPNIDSAYQGFSINPTQLEPHGCIFSTVATDALVLKHQANNIHSADKMHIISDQFHTKIFHL